MLLALLFYFAANFAVFFLFRLAVTVLLRCWIDCAVRLPALTCCWIDCFFCCQKGCNVNLYLWLCFCFALIGCVINLCQWLNSTVRLAVLLFSFILSVTLLSDSCFYYTMWLAAFYAVSNGAFNTILLLAVLLNYLIRCFILLLLDYSTETLAVLQHFVIGCFYCTSLWLAYLRPAWGWVPVPPPPRHPTLPRTASAHAQSHQIPT
jgi:hypothetical protein